MAQNRSARKLKQSPADDPDLRAHIESLGLRSECDYVAWCREHGFSPRTSKHWKERLRERTFATRAAADARLARKKNETRRPEKIIESIFRGEIRAQDVTHPALQIVCEAAKDRRQGGWARQGLLNLLIHVSRHAPELISSDFVIAAHGRVEANSFIAALIALARHRADWVRPLDEWKPRSHNVRSQFASLTRHLLARYPVPAFMDSAWFKAPSLNAERQQRWFIHLGRGENIRTADLPLAYTKRMSHHFMQAPSDLCVEAALRWGQIHALGGNAALVKAVVATDLGTSFTQDEFWTTVLQFFIANPMLDRSHIGPIVDYIQHVKFTSEDVFVAPGRIERQPPAQPNFSMKGRTAEALLRQVERWHQTLAKKEQPKAEWIPSGIAGFEFIEGSEKGENLRIWTLKELLSAKALVAEGRTMKHCVASYARSCAHGETSVWTLEVESIEGRRKVLTVEVNRRSRTICQARGKCNIEPGDKHRGILRRWAEKAQLTLASYV
ncbi:MAG: PcfJ domain-containing protein [Planctomycetaceae bacterium]|nr:PcfJ domain-containing protein [Planctomycetaceae bacterium]